MTKEPAEILLETHAMLTQLMAKVVMLESSIALLHDKANGHLFPDVKVKTGKSLPAPQMQVPTNARADVINDLTGPQGIGVPFQQPESKPEKTQVSGCVYGQNKKPLHGVSVLIQNQSKEMVSELKTDLAGEWKTELGPGKYAITYTRNGMSAIYRFLKVEPGQKEARVL